MNMRKARIPLVLSACLAGTLAFAMGSAPKGGKEGGSSPLPPAKGYRLVAYYFHGTYRCATCMAIERQSKETVEGDFAREIRAGKVVFLSLNTEEPDNGHFVKDYSLFTKSLVLSLEKDGKEEKWKNLPEVWTHVHNPEKFREYVRNEVKEMLKGAD